jgi:RNA polymerase sigma-70 factor (ECF subfamily)
LVRQHQEPAFRLAYLILGDRADAEDVTQEAFVRAYLKLDTFDEARPFRPWLLSIAANLARNRRRSIGRYWAALRRYWQNEPPAETNKPDWDGRLEARQLWQAVQRLRPKAQEIVYLRYFLDLSEAETAVTLDIAPGTAKSRLHRALKQLRAVIEADFPDLVETWNV